ncbi:MAG: hypothetical protein COT74_08305 [Bdellovibrionales bacterium CG10_big_fil_rev_8_21_14_0_10_45_34]|nr:MAG: hypothetical protein COT74_08305 [Bdellovibrionales bacterium CG10_big_fil_rev_8_21_14_0_10_45_34]
MSYEFYKLIHILSWGLLLVILGGVSLYRVEGGQKANFKRRKLVSIVHGVALLIALVTGFGLLARLGIMRDWSLWVYIKLAVWLFLGAWLAFIWKVPSKARILFGVLTLSLLIAAYAAIYKPA